MIYLFLLVAGIAGGFLAGLFGIGGGIIYVLVLPFALIELGVPLEDLPHYTIANSLLATIFASLSALVRHYWNKNLFPVQSLILGLVGGGTAILATRYIVEQAFFSMLVFNWIFLILLAYMLFDLVVFSKRKVQGNEKTGGNWKYIPIGMTGGLVSALSGLGGGIAVIPLVLKFQKLDFKQVTSVSMGFIAISSLIVSFYNSGLNNVGNALPYSLGILVFPVTITLVIGVVFGAQFGVSAAKKINPDRLRNAFAILLLLVVIWKGIEIIRLG